MMPRKRVKFLVDENEAPAINTDVTNLLNLRTEPVGKQLTDERRWNKKRRKVGLPLSAEPAKVNQRLKNQREQTDAVSKVQKRAKLNQRRMGQIIDSKRD